jgi:hypothetical protein
MHGRTFVRTTALSLFFVSLVLASFGQHQTPDNRAGEDSVVVPAGTKITVQLDYSKREGRPYIDGKVVWPVRDGFSTLIPVGAKVRADVYVLYYSDSNNNPVPVEIIQLIQIKMGDKTYRLATDTQELMEEQPNPNLR